MNRFHVSLGLAFVTLLLIAAPTTGHGDAFGYESYILATDSGAASESRVAALSDSRIVVAWRDSQGHVWTRVLENHLLLDAIDHGLGKDPAIAFTDQECHLAFARDNAIITRTSPDGTDWAAPQSVATGAGLATAHPDFGAFHFGVVVPAKDGGRDLPPVYLGWEEGGTHMVFASLGPAGWSAPVVVCTDGRGANLAYPQVEPRLVGNAVLPRLYYLSSATYVLGYRDFDGTSWSALISPPSLQMVGDQYDVAVGPDFRHQVLGMGMPPTCPCNIIGYAEETGSGWSDWTNLTNYGSDFNWPQYAALAVGGDGSRQSFWYEEYRTYGFELVNRELAWKFRWNGAWFNSPAGFFAGRFGTWTDVAADPAGSAAFFTWVEAVPGGTQVILRSPDAGGSGVPEPAAPGLLAVGVSPNPARGSINVDFARPAGAAAQLELFDTAGRLVRSYESAPATGTAGRITWDGRDGEGRAVPAGVYLTRVSAAGQVGRALLVRLN